jgi:hypothetical protein
MMLSTENEVVLASLHDCELHDLRYDVAAPQERTLTLLVTCPEEVQGKLLRIHAAAVYLFRYTAWGHCMGKEVLNTWQAGVSPATQLELQRGQEVGLAVPGLTYTVTFQSGSYFELVCRDLGIEVIS